LNSRLAASTVQGANDRIRIGVIGTGGRARGLMNLLKNLRGSALTAICHVYEPRMLQAAEIAGGTPAKVTDYRRILDVLTRERRVAAHRHRREFDREAEILAQRQRKSRQQNRGFPALFEGRSRGD
jgi:hypothetical protein